MYSDTIAAISTAMAGAGIGIIRLSGTDAVAVADKLGLSPEEIEGAIRFSLSDLNTKEEILEAIEVLKESVSDLRMIMGRRR